MDKWREVNLCKEEEEGITIDDGDVCEYEIFRRTLAGKLWSDCPFNTRAFKQTIIPSWRLKNPVEIQDLQKNMFLFRFSMKKDSENVLKNGPWSFDRNLLILKRVLGEEQLSELEMLEIPFWTRVYDLPLNIRTESMARRLGDIIGAFEEMDLKESNGIGKFLRIKVAIDLWKPLKRGGKKLKVFFKYERLPTFCFACGKIGHQLKECEECLEDDEDGYEGVEEKELPFEPWLRASPLPKILSEPRRESSSGECSRSLCACSSSSKMVSSEAREGKEGDAEVNQEKVSRRKGDKNDKEANGRKINTSKDIERVAESLGTVSITTKDFGKRKKSAELVQNARKWQRQKQ